MARRTYKPDLDKQLCSAICKKDLILTELLLSLGANPNRTCKGGLAPIHYAVGMNSHRNKGFLDLLLKFNADANVRSEFDLITPVHIAAMLGKGECLETLLEAGGDPDLQDMELKTAFDYAWQSDSYSCRTLLNDYLHLQMNTSSDQKFEELVQQFEDRIRITCNPNEENPSKKINFTFPSFHEHLSDDSSHDLNHSWPFTTTSRSHPERNATSDLDYVSSDSDCEHHVSQKNPRDIPNQPYTLVNYSISDDSANAFSNSLFSTNSNVEILESNSSSDESTSSRHSAEKLLNMPIREEDLYFLSNSPLPSGLKDSAGLDVSSPNHPHIFWKKKDRKSLLEKTIYDSNSSMLIELNHSVNEPPSLLNDCGNNFPTCGANNGDNPPPYHQCCSSVNNRHHNVCHVHMPCCCHNHVHSLQLQTNHPHPIHSSCDSYETIVRDSSEGCFFLERFYPSSNSSGASSYHTPCSILDWKSFLTATPYTTPNCSVGDPTAPLPLKSLSNKQIFDELTRRGLRPGPVNDATRSLYLRKLESLPTNSSRSFTRCSILQSAPTQRDWNNSVTYTEYTDEVAAALRSFSQIPDLYTEETALCEAFLNPNVTWREGRRKISFNYLLLDPRVTQNLPSRLNSMSELDVFRTFISAIFYVGKGSRLRPYRHFSEALSRAPNTRCNPKVQHILDIWNENQGVVSLICFQGVIPVEAYTREACMIEALGLGRLTNLRKGDYYGNASTWSIHLKRLMGLYLLKKAMNMFLNEGERQLMPADI